MRRLRFWRRLLAHFLKVVAYEWIFAFGRLVSRFWRGLKNLFKTLTLPHPEREEAGPDCTIVDNPSLHRPDPCIYSQDYLLQLGLAVTWDNPDIVLRRNGVVVPEGDVLPDTDYAIEATVWNNSYEAPAVGVRVAFSFLSLALPRSRPQSARPSSISASRGASTIRRWQRCLGERRQRPATTV